MVTTYIVCVVVVCPGYSHASCSPFTEAECSDSYTCDYACTEHRDRILKYVRDLPRNNGCRDSTYAYANRILASSDGKCNRNLRDALNNTLCNTTTLGRACHQKKWHTKGQTVGLSAIIGIIVLANLFVFTS